MEPIKLIIARVPIGKNNSSITRAGVKISIVGLKRMNPYQYKNYRDGWQWDIKAELQRQGMWEIIPEQVKKPVTIIQYRKHLFRDNDNLHASIGPILDVLKRLHLIWDDSDAWIKQEIQQYKTYRLAGWNQQPYTLIWIGRI